MLRLRVVFSMSLSLCMVSSITFTDRTLSAAEIAALGGPRAEGIFVRRLSANRNGADVLLTWIAAANTRLQGATALSPLNWQDIGGTVGASSYAQPVTNSAAFFRLVEQ